MGWHKFKIRFAVELICLVVGIEFSFFPLTVEESESLLKKMTDSIVAEAEAHAAACKAAQETPTNE